jgi:hypothetical protein
MNMTQKERVLQFLQDGGKLTRLNAWDELGVLETPARIWDLRAEGHNIKTKLTPIKNRYGEKVHIATWTLEDEA